MVIGSHVGEVTSERLTLKEAALLAGVTEKTIRHELAGRVASAHREKGRPSFCEREIVYFRLISALRFALTKADRRDLFEVVALEKNAKGHWKRFGGRLLLIGAVPTEVRVEDLAKEVAVKLRRYLSGRSRVASRPEVLGGEPVFAGTRIPVRHVGRLVKKGVPLSELAEDYPALSERDFEFAGIFVELGRPPGRPRKLKFIRGDG